MTAALALLSLTDRSVWVDEVSTEAVATAPSDRLLSDLSYNGGNMSLYLFFMRVWLHFDQSDWWLRLPSVLFAVACVGALFHLARRIVSTKAAVIAAGLLAISPPLMHHAQDARSYSLTVLLVIASWSAAMTLQSRESRPNLGWYVVGAVAVVYSHMIGVLFVGAQLAWLFTTRPRVAIRASLWISVLISPQVALGLGPNAHEPKWIPPISAGQVGATVRFLAGVEVHALAVLVVMMWVLGGFAASRRADTAAYAIIAWAALPFFGLLVVSLVTPMLVERYLLMIVPAAAVLIAMAYESFRRLGTLAVVAIVVLSAFGLQSTLTRDVPDWRTSTNQLLASADEDEAVLFVRSRQLMEHYWEQAGRPSGVPVPLSEPQRWDSVRRTYEIDVDSARAVLTRSSGAWIVDRPKPFGLSPDERRLIDEIEKRWPVVERWSFDGGQIVITRYGGTAS